MLRNFASLALMNGANILLPLLTFPYLVRVLGADSFGRMSFAASLIAYVVLLSDFGFNLTSTRDIAAAQGNRAEISHLFWRTLAAKLVLATFGMGALALAAVFLGVISQVSTLLVASTGVVLGSVLFPVWYFQGVELMTPVSVASIVGRATVLPLTFIFVKSPGDVVVATLLNSLAAMTSAAIAIGFLVSWRTLDKPAVSVHEVFKAIRASSTVFLSLAGMNLYTASNIVVLKMMSDFGTVGVFASADKLKTAALNPNSIITQVVYPRFVSVGKSGRGPQLRLLKRTGAFQIAAGLLVGLTLSLCAGPICHLALGANLRNPAAATLRVLGLAACIVPLSHIFGVQIMMGLGHKKEFMNRVLVLGAVNVLLMIPACKFYGAIGAAAVVLLTEGLVALSMIGFVRRNKLFLLE